MTCSIIKLTQQLVRRPSLSPNDAGCQMLIINRLKKIGFSIEHMDVGDTKNFWAWRGNGKTLAFAGHTDVVSTGDINRWISPPFNPVIRNGMIFGRGVADMKGSLAAMIVATERFIARYPNHKNRLAFLITSDEEASAKNGTVKVVETLLQRNDRLDYCLVGEPTSTKIVGDVVKNGRRGSLTCNLTIHGVQGHVAYPHLANNPVNLAIPMLNELLTIKWDHKDSKLFSSTTMQITNIQTSIESNNVIPGDLSVQFNFRFSSELTDEMIRQRIESLLKKHRLHYTIDWKLYGYPFVTRHGKLIDAIVETIENFNKIKPQLLTTGGTSDGRFIAKMGAQVVEFGLVNTTIHKVNECVKTTDLHILTDMYQSIIEKLLVI